MSHIWMVVLGILQRFVAFGCLGMQIELFFTGVSNIFKKNWMAQCKTYLWMFPIYGIGGTILKYCHDHIQGNSFIVSILYTGIIYVIEFCCGWILSKWLGACPWKYTNDDGKTIHKRSVLGLIRWDYSPLWYVLALAFDLQSDRIMKIVNAISRIQ